MKNVYLSKTNYCKYLQCPKMLWLKKYKAKEAVQQVNPIIFENGKKVGILAHKYFGEKTLDIKYNKNHKIMIEKTRKYLKYKPNIITEASFNYENNFCMVDLLKNDEDGVEIYEVKSSTSITDVYLDDASFQYYILSNLGLNVKKVFILYINKEYIKGDKPVEEELDKFFKVEDITSIAIKKQDEIRNNILQINNFMKEHDIFNEPCIDIGLHCSKPYECDFWEYCTKDLPTPNIFDINRMKKRVKFEKYYEGKVSFEDLLEEDLKPAYHEQIDFEVNNKGPKIDKNSIKDLLDSLKYPLYFIDYETYMTPIPEMRGTKPYQQIPFQYSLHILKDKDAELEHREFLAEVDDENMIRTFAERMINDIADDGSVIVYNKSFEQSRNNEIAGMYPDLKDEIDRINNNMVDFMEPFIKRQYYAKQMKGSYSIKEVLPALYPDDPELVYDNLPLVHNGGEAPEAFRSLKDKKVEEQAEIREGLLAYCKLDTLAMVKIYEKFNIVTRE